MLTENKYLLSVWCVRETEHGEWGMGMRTKTGRHEKPRPRHRGVKRDSDIGKGCLRCNHLMEREGGRGGETEKLHELERTWPWGSQAGLTPIHT